jgi:hypothetical protein
MEAPPTLTYSSVVSRDSVHIALLVAALNDLNILSCDIQNVYLTANCREQIYTIAGPEFGSKAGSIMLVKKALYGLKSSGAAFRAHLAKTLYEADPDVWIQPANRSDGFKYNKMLLVYVDDVLCISHNAKATMKGIQGKSN